MSNQVATAEEPHDPCRIPLIDRISINIFGDATRIARALGLDIDLPDCDCTDASYWERVRAEGWKNKIAGRIEDPWFQGDDDWALLARLACGELWFDIEEGIKIRTTPDRLGQAVELIRGLEHRGVPLVDPDDGQPMVIGYPCYLRKDRERENAFIQAFQVGGFTPGKGTADLDGWFAWELPPFKALPGKRS